MNAATREGVHESVKAKKKPARATGLRSKPWDGQQVKTAPKRRHGRARNEEVPASIWAWRRSREGQ